MGHTIPMSTSIARGSVCTKKTDRRNGDFPRGQGASDRSDRYRKREMCIRDSLLRWGIFVPTMQAFNKTDEGRYSGAGSNVTDKTWPYPIPQNEIDFVGGSLVQNENY